MSEEAPDRGTTVPERTEPERGADPASVEALEQTIEQLKGEASEHWNNYLRAVAELDNLRKRSSREVENARKFGIERFVQDILPVRDSLEAALTAGESADAATLLEGERATLRLLDQALQAAGGAEIDPVGEPFDPAKHEAMSMQPSDRVEPDSVLEVVQKGYRIHERVVRPARVIVARAPAAPGGAGEA